MSNLFDVFFNMEAELVRFSGTTDRYNNPQYEETPEKIKVFKYGPSEYKRRPEEEAIEAEYIYQTLAEVKVRDKIDGYVVTRVKEHYDLLGNLLFREVHVVNG